MSIGIIGGTGLCSMAAMDLSARTVTTSHGAVELQVGTHRGSEVVFVPRHGGGHETPPHRINYRATIAALKKVGVRSVVATSAVGTLSAHIPPGALTLLGDFIDHTEGRTRTFFEEDVIHLDYTEPYCRKLRGELAEAAHQTGIELHHSATYVCTNGPRFETPAEIRMFGAWGADVVGMTNVPEVVLAREAELCYAVIALATNDAAGVTGRCLTHTEVDQMFNSKIEEVVSLLETFIDLYEECDCVCHHALDEYRQRRNQPDLSIPL